MNTGRYRKAMILQYSAIKELEAMGFGRPNNVRFPKVLQPKMKIGKRRQKKIRDAVRKVKGR